MKRWWWMCTCGGAAGHESQEAVAVSSRMHVASGCDGADHVLAFEYRDPRVVEAAR